MVIYTREDWVNDNLLLRHAATESIARIQLNRYPVPDAGAGQCEAYHRRRTWQHSAPHRHNSASVPDGTVTSSLPSPPGDGVPHPPLTTHPYGRQRGR